LNKLEEYQNHKHPDFICSSSELCIVIITHKLEEEEQLTNTLTSTVQAVNCVLLYFDKLEEDQIINTLTSTVQAVNCVLLYFDKL